MSARDKVRFVLCADDFGLSPAISEGILEVVAAQRLSAVSCMATLEGLTQAGPELQKLVQHVDIGLHLTLTDQQPLGPMPFLAADGILPTFRKLAKASITGYLPVEEIHAELGRQYNRFIEIFGRAPDFIDGHHHIQQLPMVRTVVLDLANQGPGKRPWLRSCDEKISRIIRRGVSVKKAMIVGWPGRAFKRHARSRNLNCNVGFSGIYDFSDEIPYETLFDRFTDELSAGALVMSHPGRVDGELRRRDSLTDQRETELNFLLGDKFDEILTAKNLCLARFEKCFDS